MLNKSSNKTILVVEDEVSLLNALTEKFENEGFDILQAKDGEEGLEIASEHHPDLILLDIVLPKMDGLKMAEELKKRPKPTVKNIHGEEEEIGLPPILLLTNLDDLETVVKAQGQGLYDYLVKSDWKIEDVVKRVKEKLGI
jgi:two-component system, OmpR family, alkaline phosphatase synthesis response regulator PhoP